MSSSIKHPILLNCLKRLLQALHWHGNVRYLQESLPHFSELNNAESFSEVMAHLNYNHKIFSTHLNELDQRLFPCLFISKENKPFILLKHSSKGIKAYDGESKHEQILTDLTIQGKIYLFKSASTDVPSNTERNHGLFIKFCIRHKLLLSGAVIFSSLLSLLSLATPLFIMVVYDQIVGRESSTLLIGLLVGILIALIATEFFYGVRARVLAFLGARLDRDVGNTVFERLLYLAPSYTENASVGAQVARLRSFNMVRDFSTSPLLIMLFDLPFVIIFLVVIFILGGSLILVPIVVTALLALITLLINSKSNQLSKKTTQSNAKQQEFLLESLNNLLTIKQTATETIWRQRYREISATNALNNMKMSLSSAFNNSITDIMMIGSGLAVLFVGSIKIFNNTLSIGALIAVMMLTWKCVAPLKTLFVSLPWLQQLISSIRQIHTLLNIEPEIHPALMATSVSCHFKGAIHFERVSFRYPNTSTPALLNVSFEVFG